MVVDMPVVNHYDTAIAQYENIQENGGWGTIPYSGIYREGKNGDFVLQAKARFEVTGDFYGDASDPTFGEALTEATKNFQERHGIEVDGIIGPITLREMNVSVSARIDQLQDAQNEWNKLDLSHPKQYIINVPGQVAWAMEGDVLWHQTKIIVGRKDRQTKIFSDEVSYIEFAPTWNVPHSIAVKDILPKLRRDSSYAVRNDFVITRNGRVIDPTAVNWYNYSASWFPFSISQRAGDKNALGKVKIKFPNRFAIYMHDTPAKSLFEMHRRTFSSGCVRLQEPDLFTHFALKDIGYTLDDVNELMNLSKSKGLWLKDDEKIPVHLMYLLSWVAEDGTIHFAQDIYNKGGSYSALKAPVDAK